MERIKHENRTINDYLSRTDDIIKFYKREKNFITLKEINTEISKKIASYTDIFEIDFRKNQKKPGHSN